MPGGVLIVRENERSSLLYELGYLAGLVRTKERGEGSKRNKRVRVGSC